MKESLNVWKIWDVTKDMEKSMFEYKFSLKKAFYI